MIEKKKKKKKKMKKKLKNLYSTGKNVLIRQDLWQAKLSNFVNNLAEGIHKIK